jgi:tripartite-type tricarboxylate transporter receptor subunit TctC
MKYLRRDFLRLAAGAAIVPALADAARAESYPTRPVHMIVCFPGGTATDIIARLTGRGLSEQLGQQFVIENRPGAGGNLGTEFVARAAPDGYTLLTVVAPNAINATLYDNLNFNFIHDIAPVGGIGRVPFVVAAASALPAKTIAEFIAYAKGNPGKVNMVTGGNGTATDVFGEMFEIMTGVSLVKVPYRSDYMADLISGQVQIVFGPMPSLLTQIQDGRVRALAVTTASRSPALPNTPALGEFVAGYEASGWYGVGAPRSTPTEIVVDLNKALNAVLSDPDVKTRLAAVGAEPMPMTAVEFGTFVADETEKWAKVIRTANIKPD